MLATQKGIVKGSTGYVVHNATGYAAHGVPYIAKVTAKQIRDNGTRVACGTMLAERIEDFHLTLEDAAAQLEAALVAYHARTLGESNRALDALKKLREDGTAKVVGF